MLSLRSILLWWRDPSFHSGWRCFYLWWWHPSYWAREVSCHDQKSITCLRRRFRDLSLPRDPSLRSGWRLLGWLLLGWLLLGWLRPSYWACEVSCYDGEILHFIQDDHYWKVICFVQDDGVRHAEPAKHLANTVMLSLYCYDRESKDPRSNPLCALCIYQKYLPDISIKILKIFAIRKSITTV